MQKILIVDDSGSAIAHVRAILQQHGFEVIATESPFAFGQLLGQTRPDLALVDVNLPAIRGDKLVQMVRLSEIPHRCPMILYTSKAVEHVERLVWRCGAAGYISKDADPETLIERIHGFLREAASERGTLRPK